MTAAMSCALLIALLLVAPSVGAAPGARPKSRSGASTPTARESAEKLLRRSERAPGPAELAALGPGAEAAMLAIARGDGVSEAEALLLRSRATSALAHLTSPRVRAFLIQVVSNPTRTADPAELLVLRRAAVALGWQGGPAAPEPLGGLLDHPDPEVRTDAAVGLGLTRLAPAATKLRARLPQEKDPRVRGHMERQLRTIEESLQASDRGPGGGRRSPDQPPPPPPSGLGAGKQPSPPMRSRF